jgi:hypothetical protein
VRKVTQLICESDFFSGFLLAQNELEQMVIDILRKEVSFLGSRDCCSMVPDNCFPISQLESKCGQVTEMSQRIRESFHLPVKERKQLNVQLTPSKR